MPVEKRALEGALAGKLGCERRETHHHCFDFIHEGKSIKTFRTPHSKAKYKTIDDSGIRYMINDLDGVTVHFFKKFVKCSKSKEDLIEKIMSSSLVRSNENEQESP